MSWCDSPIAKTILEGSIYALLTVLLLFATLPAEATPPYQEGSFFGKLFTPDFASRWDGTCNGWTKEVAGLHVVGNLLTWYAYVLVAVAMYRLHPILSYVRYSHLTLVMIVLVFLTCGATHLVEAYMTFNPLYRTSGLFNMFAGIVGMAGAAFITRSLGIARDVANRRRREVEQLLADKLRE